MIIIDFSQLIVATVAQEFNRQKIEIDLVRHVAMNMIRHYNSKFRGKYGRIVIACDGGKSWRKDQFPHYKAQRAKQRNQIGIDWPQLFKCIDQLYSEIDQHLPYPILRVPTAEADDIIAFLTTLPGKHIIISSDKDFFQLLGPTVSQYSPIHKSLITVSDAALKLKQHIIKGDSIDGIPNILSNDDCFVNKIRQKPIRQDRLSQLVEQDLETSDDQQLRRNWFRNKALIDLTQTPQNLKDQIAEQWTQKCRPSPAQSIYKYLASHNMKILLQQADQF